MQYLDQATGTLRDLGITPIRPDFTPINALLEKISDLDRDRIAVISRTLGQTEVFNKVVRDQTPAMDIGNRYEDIAKGFNSIRDDAKTMVDQLADGKIDFSERVANIWMKLTRGDVTGGFDKIRAAYLEVTKSAKDQIEREANILDAYHDFRSALKQSEVLALEVLKKAETKLDTAKSDLAQASGVVEGYTGTDPAGRANLELKRDEQLRVLQNEDKRYQIAKDLADNLTISYNTSEVIMARLHQTTNAKERAYAQAVSFFSTNDSVLTALKASFTGLIGLHESTQSLEAITNFQEKSFGIIEEMRKLSTQNSEEIRTAVEDGKRRLEALILEGKAIGANV